MGRRRGIGAGIAAGLASDGWDLVLSHWRPYDERLGLEGSLDDPVQVAEELRRDGRRVEVIPADLEDPRAAEAVIRQAVVTLGPLSALVMSHCESIDSGVLNTTVESFDRHYAVNVRASWLLVRAFAQQLPESGGCAVALTSDAIVGNLPYGGDEGGA